MKKSIYISVIVFSCLSCADNLQKDMQYQENTTITACLTPTKVSIDPAGKTSWDADDEIGVFIGGEIVKFTLESGDGTAEATFVTDGDIRGKNFNGVAVYPFDESLTLDGKAFSVKLKADGENDKNLPAPMSAVQNADGTFAFRNIAAILRVQYTNLPEKAEYVKCTASHSISGTFVISDYENPVLTMPLTASGNIVKSYIPEGRTYVDIPIPVGTLDFIKVELVGNDGKVIDTHSTTNKTFTVSTVKPLEAIELPADNNQ